MAEARGRLLKARVNDSGLIPVGISYIVSYIFLYPRILEELGVANVSEHLPSQP